MHWSDREINEKTNYPSNMKKYSQNAQELVFVVLLFFFFLFHSQAKTTSVGKVRCSEFQISCSRIEKFLETIFGREESIKKSVQKSLYLLSTSSISYN